MLVAAACEDDNGGRDAATTTSTTTEPVTSLHESGCPYIDDARVQVTPDCLNAEWPLTTDVGEVYCAEPSAALLRVPGGMPGGGIYALNGFASTAFPELPDLENVWRESPESEGLRVSIGPLIQIALDLC